MQLSQIPQNPESSKLPHNGDLALIKADIMRARRWARKYFPAYVPPGEPTGDLEADLGRALAAAFALKFTDDQMLVSPVFFGKVSDAVVLYRLV